MNELFKNISWSDYLLTVGAVVGIYYIIVLLVHFRSNLKKRIFPGHAALAVDERETHERQPEGKELLAELERTVEDIGKNILVPGNQATPEELLEQLKQRVAAFGGLAHPGYRYALNNAIISKAEANCGISYSEADLENAWKSLPV